MNAEMSCFNAPRIVGGLFGGLAGRLFSWCLCGGLFLLALLSGSHRAGHEQEQKKRAAIGESFGCSVPFADMFGVGVAASYGKVVSGVNRRLVVGQSATDVKRSSGKSSRNVF